MRSSDIVDEEQADAATFERDRERIDYALHHPARTLGLLALLGIAARPGRPLAASGGRSAASAARDTTASTSRSRRRHRPGTRAAAARPGRQRGLVRVHRDPVRPDPARALPRRAGDDAAAELGRAAPRGRRRPAAVGGRGRHAEPLRTAGRRGDRRRARVRDEPPFALPHRDRAASNDERRALRRLQGGGRRRGRPARVAALPRARPARCRAARLRRGSAPCCSGSRSTAGGPSGRAGTTSCLLRSASARS